MSAPLGVVVPGPHQIELRSGAYLDLWRPDPGAISVGDVAVGLARTCRFSGQCERFYSVAEHALLVEARLQAGGWGVPVRLAGLHHDDAEAFVGDATRPLKSLIPGQRPIEAAVQRAIAVALELPPLSSRREARAVKAADDWALACEAFQLLRSRGRGWCCDGLYAPDDEPGGRLANALSAAEAEREWLAAHRRLTRELAARAA